MPEISQRYKILDQIGAGGMGAVYRTLDRLTGEYVALKRVLPPGQSHESDGYRHYHPTQERHALVREFQTLASLRHPNIVTVLDYGFDNDQQPFFTMELFEDATSIRNAAEGHSVKGKIELITQLLRALAYLHRREVLHRDLKPANVQVVNGQVKVLDFGLSTLVEQALEDKQTTGTLAYMAPELLEQKPASVASDLYAVGVIAYEILYGRHPYDTSNSTVLIDEVLEGRPDFRSANLDPALIRVLERLLARQPYLRYGSANAVIDALRLALRESLVLETHATRESFLQGARFVGRVTELRRIDDDLMSALNGKGQILLIGGESGVGKSRLIGEARIRGLVRGALVVNGQAIRDGGSPYRLWREVIRRLALEVDLTQEEIRILRMIVPDIETLLGQNAAPGPDIDPKAVQLQLYVAVRSLLERQTRPIILVLEDIQWADAASLALVGFLGRVIHEFGTLILGSFRDDERFSLPSDLAALPVIRLNRLGHTDITALCVAMLGDAGKQPDLVRLVEKETEGNAFFIVEVVRALAADAGRLDRIDERNLPDRVIAGGIKAIIDRRLSLIPPLLRPLLELAAVAGREIDLALLAYTYGIESAQMLEEILIEGAEASVLEFTDGTWRFSHDKLREGLLAALKDTDRQTAHLKIAQAIERVYADDLTLHYADLVFHYHAGAQRDRERYYSRLAGEQAARSFSNNAALGFFSRALELTDAADLIARFQLYRAREAVYNLQGVRPEQHADIQAMSALAEQLDHDDFRAEVAYCEANYAVSTGAWDQAITSAKRAVKLAEHIGALEIAARAYREIGSAWIAVSNHVAAQVALERALELSRQLGDLQIEADSLRLMGNNAFYSSNYDPAFNYYERAHVLYARLNNPLGERYVLGNLGVIATARGNLDEARDHYSAALDLARATGDRPGEGLAQYNLGLNAMVRHDFGKAYACFNIARHLWETSGNRLNMTNVTFFIGRLACWQGNYDEARMLCHSALAMFQELKVPDGESWALAELSEIARQLDTFAAALDYAAKANRLAETSGNLTMKQFVLTSYGLALECVMRYDQAIEVFHQALPVLEKVGRKGRRLEVLAGLLRIAMAREERERISTLTESLLKGLETQELLSCEDPIRVYLTGVHALHVNHDPRADGLLQTAYENLQRWSETWGDPLVQEMYLTMPGSHRELQAMMKELRRG